MTPEEARGLLRPFIHHARWWPLDT